MSSALVEPVPYAMLPQLLAVSHRTLTRLPLLHPVDGVISWPAVCAALNLPHVHIVSGRALLRPAEAAWALSCTTRTIRAYCRSGRLRRLHIAGHPRLARITAASTRALWTSLQAPVPRGSP